MSTGQSTKCHSERSEKSNSTAACGYHSGFFAALRMTVMGIGLLIGHFAHAAEPEMRLSPKKVRDEVRTVVEAQLAALQAGQFCAACDFAAHGVKREFDHALVSRRIRPGI